uniref:Uncharacterized protein n=1 Tax=Chenopodium quinoa TaxID=63459 RepID=A0A803MT94_CHEQI
MIFMDFPLTLNLFQRLHWIKRDSQSPEWWSLFTAPGIDKLDFSRLGLHSHGRVKQQCPDRPKKSYDTLPVFATRASKRKRKRQQDMTPTERVTKPCTLAVKRGGGNASKRTSESSDREQQKKQKKHDGDAAPFQKDAQETWPEGVVNLEDETDLHPPKKLTVTLRDPKGLGVSSEVRTVQMASIEKPPSKETTIVLGRTGDPIKNAFVPALVGDFIEIPHVRIPAEVADELAVPFGAAGDPWHPRINVNRGESVSVTTLRLAEAWGGGYSRTWRRQPKGLPTALLSLRSADEQHAPGKTTFLPTVNSVVEVVHMYQHYQRAADNAETKLKKADDACKLVIKERDKVKSDMKTLQKQVLTDQEQLQKKYTAGWVSAHRYVCKAERWDSTKWQAVEKDFNEEMNHSPTSYESEYFDELPLHAVITNLDPRELPEVEFDDGLISSPVTTHAGKDGSVGPSNKDTVKEPVNAAETTKEADKN